MRKIVENIIGDFFSRYAIVKLSYHLKSRELLLLPPMSSYLLKSVIETESSFQALKNLYNSQKRPRKVMFRTVKTDKGNPLYSVINKTGLPIHMKPNRTYETELVVISENLSFLDSVIANPSGSAKSPYGNVDFELIDVNIFKQAPSVEADSKKIFKLEVITPALLSSKLAVPTWMQKPASKTTQYHRLSASPGLFAASVLKAVLEHRGAIGKKDEKLHYFALRYFDALIEELDLMLEPETAIIGKDDKGNLRIARGIKGWFIYRPMKSSAGTSFAKLLWLGSVMGIGRSRSIGFGEAMFFIKNEESIGNKQD